MTELVDKLPSVLAGPARIAIATKNFVIVAASLIMALTFGFVVVARYCFSADLFAYEEWLMVICFWMFFMGSAVATYDKSHVNADLLGFILENPRAIWTRNVAVEFIELLVTCAIIYWAWLMINDEISYYPRWQTTIALHIPFLVPRLGIFLGFVLMGFYSALHLYVLLKMGPPELRENNQLIPRKSARKNR